MRYLALVALALLPAAGPPHVQDKGSESSLSGHCEANPTLAAMMKSRDNAKEVITVQCDRLVVRWGESVSAYRGSATKPEIVFAGHKGDETDITLDSVSLHGNAPVPTTNGRCRFYKNDTEHEMLVLCFGIYRDSQPAGAIVTFRTPLQTP